MSLDVEPECVPMLLSGMCVLPPGTFAIIGPCNDHYCCTSGFCDYLCCPTHSEPTQVLHDLG